MTSGGKLSSNRDFKTVDDTVLYLELVSGRNMARADMWGGKSDPYCKVFLERKHNSMAEVDELGESDSDQQGHTVGNLDSRERLGMTNVVWNNLDPNWRKMAVGPKLGRNVVEVPHSALAGKEEYILVIEVWDWDMMGSGDFLGMTTLTDTDLMSLLVLDAKKKTRGGDVEHLGVHFDSVGFVSTPELELKLEPSGGRHSDVYYDRKVAKGGDAPTIKVELRNTYDTQYKTMNGLRDMGSTMQSGLSATRKSSVADLLKSPTVGTGRKSFSFSRASSVNSILKGARRASTRRKSLSSVNSILKDAEELAGKDVVDLFTEVSEVGLVPADLQTVISSGEFLMRMECEQGWGSNGSNGSNGSLGWDSLAPVRTRTAQEAQAVENAVGRYKIQQAAQQAQQGGRGAEEEGGEEEIVLRPYTPKSRCDRQLRNVMEQCWASNPSARPDMGVVAAMIETELFGRPCRSVHTESQSTSNSEGSGSHTGGGGVGSVGGTSTSGDITNESGHIGSGSSSGGGGGGRSVPAPPEVAAQPNPQHLVAAQPNPRHLVAAQPSPQHVLQDRRLRVQAPSTPQMLGPLDFSDATAATAFRNAVGPPLPTGLESMDVLSVPPLPTGVDSLDA
jgi:hypothetical protein